MNHSRESSPSSMTTHPYRQLSSFKWGHSMTTSNYGWLWWSQLLLDYLPYSLHFSCTQYLEGGISSLESQVLLLQLWWKTNSSPKRRRSKPGVKNSWSRTGYPLVGSLVARRRTKDLVHLSPMILHSLILKSPRGKTKWMGRYPVKVIDYFIGLNY